MNIQEAEVFDDKSPYSDDLFGGASFGGGGGGGGSSGARRRRAAAARARVNRP